MSASNKYYKVILSMIILSSRVYFWYFPGCVAFQIKGVRIGVLRVGGSGGWGVGGGST